jgi:uncharacterized protein (TIRG00374 family)
VNPHSELLARPLPSPRRRASLRFLLVILGIAVLLALALRLAPLAGIWESLRRLSLWQVAALLLINAFVLICMTLRWWLVLRPENPRLPFLPLLGYRLSVFSLSYFTVGPQVGGEPLQVLYLRRDYGLSLARATASVIMDKLLELLGNFVFIGLGLCAVMRLGLIHAGPSLSGLAWFLLAALLSWPLVHIFLLSRRIHPVSAFLHLFFHRFRRQKWFRLVVASERLISAFIRRHPSALFASLGASLLAWTGMAVEYVVMLNFLDLHLGLWQALAALTASLLAFLVPLPGGLGALEASQVLALGSLGYPAAPALALALLMRARDLFNGGLGLLLAARSFTRAPARSRPVLS